jgi:hypothetical protein
MAAAASSIKSANLHAYAPFDRTAAVPVCEGEFSHGPITPSKDAAYSPFEYRRHEFLHVSPKRLVHVSLAEPVRQWIKQNFGDTPVEVLSRTVTDMESDRKTMGAFVEPHCFREENYLGDTIALNDVHDEDDDAAGDGSIIHTFSVGNFVAAQNTGTRSLFQQMEKTYLPAVRRYLSALQSLISKGVDDANPNGLESISNLRFEWHYWLGDLYDVCWHTEELRVELCAALFNLGSMYSMSACAPPSSLGESVRLPDGSLMECTSVLGHRSKYFRHAAFVFRHLSDILDKHKLVIRELDVNVIDIFATLMLAQAQECTYWAHRNNDDEPLTPEIHMRLCKMSRCCAEYYHKFVKLYQQYKTSCENTDTKNHLPTSWVYHIIECFVELRLITNLHYAHGLSEKESGVKAAFMIKCSGILRTHLESLERQIHEIGDHYPDIIGLHLRNTRDGLQWITKTEQLAIQYNRNTYNERIPTQEEIAHYNVSPLDKVQLPVGVVPTDETLRVLVQPQDSFSVLVSAATHIAWMEYRQERAKRYCAHLNNQSTQFQRMVNVWRNGSHKLLLAYIHRQLLAREQEQQQHHRSFYETPLGQNIVLLKNTNKIRLLNAGVLRITRTDHVEMVSSISRMELALRNPHVQVGKLTKKRAETLAVEKDCVATLCDHMNNCYREIETVLERLLALHGERDYINALFGRYAEMLFPSSALPAAAHVALPAATSQIISDSSSFPATQNPSERVIAQIQEGAAVAHTLLETQIHYEALEDELVAMLEKDMSKSSTHLDTSQLSGVSSWIDDSLQWMEDIIAKMRNLERDMELAEKKLDTIVISAKHLYRYCAIVSGKPDLSAINNKEGLHGNDDLLSDSMPELANIVTALMMYKQTYRELAVTQEFITRITKDSRQPITYRALQCP